MFNHTKRYKRKRFNWLAFGLTQAVAGLALFLLLSNIDRVDTLFLIIFGMSGMGIAIFIVVSASSQPQASIGVWFTILLTLQHGGGWISEKIFTDQHYSRFIPLTDNMLAKSVALTGIGLLTFSCAYAYYNASRRKNNKVAACVSPTRNSAIDQISWSILLIWGVGFLIFESTGGLNMMTGNSIIFYILRSIFGFLAISLLVLISIKILASNIKLTNAFLLILIIWILYILLIGQRQSIVEIGLSTLVLSSKWRLVEVKARHIFLLLMFLLSIMIGMIYIRDIYGREMFSMNLSDQLGVLSQEQPIDQGSLRENIVYDLGYRLNAGNILLGLVADQPIRNLFWIEPVTYSIIKLMPGFIWTSKAQDLIVGELPRLIANHYKLPIVDYIATYITTFYAMGGVPMLIFLTSVLGSTVAFLDIKFAQNTSFFILVLAIGVTGGLLMIDHSIDGLFIRIRDSLVLYLLLKSSNLVRNAVSKA